MSAGDAFGLEVSRHARAAGLPAGASVVMTAGALALADHVDDLLRNKRAGALSVAAIWKAQNEGLSAERPEVVVTISSVRLVVQRGKGVNGEPLGFSIGTFWEAELAGRAARASRPVPGWRRWLS